MKFKAFIFDLDGTLLDSLKDLINSVNYALEQLGQKSLCNKDVQNFGDNIGSIIEYIIPETKKKDKVWINRMLGLIVEQYSKSWTTNTSLYPGIDKILDTLTLHKVPMAIISNKPESFLVQTVSYYLKKWDFVKIVGSQSIFPEKPNPISTLETIKDFGIPKESIAFVGDSITDIQVAHAADISAIAVSWGYGHIQALAQSNPEYIIHTPDEILQYI